MIRIPDLTDDLLAELGREVGGCSFTDAGQKEFLASAASCDVQAAPGNGKTTLLVAKLALLARAWTSRTQGVCVISHTNAARIEVEKKLSGHPRAAGFLTYPHFVGTVTTFIDHFIALPYLRGLGWTVRRIDDEAFEAIAKSRYGAKRTLRNTAQRQRNSVETWVANLELTPDFVCLPGAAPDRLSIRGRHRQPGPHTASGAELEQLKAELTRDGYFRFGDMTSIATQALDKCPHLVQRLRDRFPLVILDEAQDTQGPQLALLKRLFGEGTAFQLLGDQNQTLYDDPDVEPEDCWQPDANAIPLDATRRFGTGVADFASRLTIRKPQIITGVVGQAGRRSLILFDRATIRQVIPTFADEVREHFAGGLPDNHQTWAVASRHNAYRQQGGNWPKSLVDYHPEYRSGSVRSGKPHSLCSILRQASLKNSAHGAPADISSLVAQGLAELLRLLNLRDALNQAVSPRSVWRALAAKGKNMHVALKFVVYDQAVKGVATWDQAVWGPFVDQIATMIGFDLPEPAATTELSRFLQFTEQGADAAGVVLAQGARTSATFGELTVRLGSIHSVKGSTVDSILVVETEVYKGAAAADKAMDLTVVLPHAFGLEERDFAATNAHLTAATNVFVGVTRARSVLALAMRKEAATADLIRAAEEQDWNVRDVTRPV